jgi:hypothetical protein
MAGVEGRGLRGRGGGEPRKALIRSFDFNLKIQSSIIVCAVPPYAGDGKSWINIRFRTALTSASFSFGLIKFISVIEEYQY